MVFLIKGLVLNGCILLIILIEEVLDLRSKYMCWTNNINLVFSIVAMLNFHLSVTSYINVGADIAPLFLVMKQPHVQVKGGLSFVLAVLNA